MTTPVRYRRRLAELTPPALRAALALAEIHFPQAGDGAALVIDPDDARFFLSGQLGVWSHWRDGLTGEQLSAIDTLLRHRPRRLAKESGFRVSLQTRLQRDRLPRYRELADQRLLVIEGVPAEQVLADALSELEDAAQERWRVPPVAQGGRQYPAAVYLDSGGGRQEFRRNTYWIPDVDLPQVPLQVAAGKAPSELMLDAEELLRVAARIDETAGRAFSLHDLLRLFLDGLRTADGQPVAGLDLRAGPLNLLVAPTGTGKSVLTRVAATALAQAGNVLVVVVPDIETTLSLVQDIQDDLAACGQDIEVVGLMSPRRLVEVATQRSDEARDDHERARWTWGQIGYSCLLPIDDGPAWQPGQEPCTDLREPGAEGRYRCPLISACEKWQPWRQAAATAQIIVTNHAYFQSGSVPIPVHLGGHDRGRVSVQEFLLSRADALMIDEIDAFQAHAVHESGRTLALARRDGGDLLLDRLNRQRQEQVRAGTVPREQADPLEVRSLLAAM